MSRRRATVPRMSKRPNHNPRRHSTAQVPEVRGLLRELPIATVLGPAKHQARLDREVAGKPPRSR